jgi:hypothetical protein
VSKSGPSGKFTWHALYGRQRWRKLAKAQMQREPCCRWCAQRGLAVPARVADHVVPHHGDLAKFYCGELQSLCVACHEMKTKGSDADLRRGYARDVDPVTGYPIDPRHPVYRAYDPFAKGAKAKGAKGGKPVTRTQARKPILPPMIG